MSNKFCIFTVQKNLGILLKILSRIFPGFKTQKIYKKLQKMKRLFLAAAIFAAMVLTAQARQDDNRPEATDKDQVCGMTVEEQIRYYNRILALDITVPGISRAEAKREAIRIAETVEDTDRQTHYIFAIAIADSVGAEKMERMQKSGSGTGEQE